MILRVLPALAAALLSVPAQAAAPWDGAPFSAAPAAIGVLMGSGMYQPAVVATVITLGVLAGFRWIEARVPSHKYAHHRVRFERGQVMPEETLREILARHGFETAALAYQVTDDGRYFEYRTTIRTNDERNFARLARSLEALPPVREFRISPTGD